jgi:hypothetical protein
VTIWWLQIPAVQGEEILRVHPALCHPYMLNFLKKFVLLGMGLESGCFIHPGHFSSCILTGHGDIKYLFRVKYKKVTSSTLTFCLAKATCSALKMVKIHPSVLLPFTGTQANVLCKAQIPLE